MKPSDEKPFYTRRQQHQERAYGPYWYSGIWSVLRQALILLCAFLVVFGLITSAVRLVRSRYFDAVDPKDTTPVAFTVASGTSLTRVAANLEEQQLIRSRSVFRYYADLLGYSQKIQAGDYTLNRGMDLPEIIGTLISGDGKPLVRNITIVPGWTVPDIARYLTQQRVLKEESDFLTLCQSVEGYDSYYYIHDILADGSAARRSYPLEGYLAPDTYEIYTSATADDIIRKLLSQTGTVFTSAYFDRLDALNSRWKTRYTMDDIIIMASVIEKEAGAGDFARVAAIFYNRLRAGMRLQSDATVKYLTGISRLALTGEDTAVSSPYNTYLRDGLPAGPICCPSPQAIYAALYPDEAFMVAGQQYYYFCTREPESGQLYFSRTLAEHEAAVAQYRPLWEAWDAAHRGAGETDE